VTATSPLAVNARTADTIPHSPVKLSSGRVAILLAEHRPLYAEDAATTLAACFLLLIFNLLYFLLVRGRLGCPENPPKRHDSFRCES
jgi:hypothetical protein